MATLGNTTITNLNSGTIRIQPIIGNYQEGIRIQPYAAWSTIMLLGTDTTATSDGTSAKSWGIFNNDGNFYINKGASDSQQGPRLWGHANGFTIGNTSTSTCSLNTVNLSCDTTASIGSTLSVGTNLSVGGTSTLTGATTMKSPLTFTTASGISYKGTQATYQMIAFIDNVNDGNGNGIKIGGGGSTLIGGGESATQTATLLSSGGDEKMIVSNDAAIEFYSNCQSGIGSAKSFSMDASGNFNINAGLLNITNNGNTTTIGSQNNGYCHIYNSANVPFIFNKSVESTSGALGSTTYRWSNLYTQAINSTGEIRLYAESGDSPHLLFQRGTTSDGTYDWDMFVTGGVFKLRNNSNGTWHERLIYDPDGSCSISNNVRLASHLTLMAAEKHNTDQWINFKYSSTDLDNYSWRLGYRGTGGDNDNNFVIQSNGNGAWVDVLKFGLTDYKATFSGGLATNALSATTGSFSSNVSITGNASIDGNTSIGGNLSLGNITISNNTISMGSAGLPQLGGTNIATNSIALGKNGIGISCSDTRNDGAAIFVENTKSENNSLIIALGDDAATEGQDYIGFRYYNTSGEATYESKIPQKSGTIALISDIPTLYVRAGTTPDITSIKDYCSANPSFMGTTNSTEGGTNSVWYNLISCRHRNGSSDGTDYGMYFRSTLTDSGSLVWNKQYGASKWTGNRTILDSSNYTSYAVPSGRVVFTPKESELSVSDVLARTGSWSLRKGTWDYANNGYVKAGSFGNIDLAGCSVLTFGDSNTYTQLYITAPTASGHEGLTNEMFFYNDHGSGYNPAWTRIMTNRNVSSYALPYTGGTIKNSTETGPFNIDTDSTTEVGMRFKMSGAAKSWVGYHPTHGSIFYNYASGKYAGLNDSGEFHVNGTKVSLSGHTHDYLPLIGGIMKGDINFKAANTDNDCGDIVWTYNNGQEKCRIWTPNDVTSKTGPYYRIYKSDGTLLYTGSLSVADHTHTAASNGAHTHNITATGTVTLAGSESSGVLTITATFSGTSTKSGSSGAHTHSCS